MAKVEPVPCPHCEGKITVYQSAGGRGTGDQTSYAARCDSCDLLQDHFGDNGRLDNATRGFNRWALEEKAKLAGQPFRAAQRKFATEEAFVAPVRSDWESGFYCAVAVVLREGYDNVARSLFGQGGNPSLADPVDIDLFRAHGLMK